MNLRLIAISMSGLLAAAIVARNLHPVAIDVVLVEVRVPLVLFAVVVAAASAATTARLGQARRRRARARVQRRRDTQLVIARSREASGAL